MSGELSTILGDIAAVEAEMQTNIADFAGSSERARANRARHVRLLERREELSRPAMPPGDWHGGDGGMVERARDAANRLLGAFAREPDQGRAFRASFEGLPRAVQEACFSELSRYKPGFVKNASDDELAGIRDGLMGGEGLIAAWGWKAREKLGRALDAVERIEKSLSPADLRQWKGWFSRIPHRERVLLLWGAAG
jgi:hypothetical protein